MKKDYENQMMSTGLIVLRKKERKKETLNYSIFLLNNI